ncbi:LptA/OstA family protein [Parasphingopyxis lamellibrachiae]|uniref:Lipopolysaccharide export system protein LptA n=1 Tax=Parasphingopyxis lamellibrachiae TaxID=680125 RepID=A0A3D9FHY4_9SPHN|nr:LptA/OstA family protein [Parasphingopyxis lamellibrachiae]RED17399.1 lipopolysaccharide export system protein LptA [Parasphingopyxis lamellibrachiae]
MTRSFLLPAAAGFALMMLAAVPASSQSALGGLNTNAPVDVAADRIEVQDRADRAIFSGNVQVRQGNLSLDAARITVAYSGSVTGGVEVRRLDASGGVFVRSPSETARGQFGVYDLDRRLITLIGGVELNQGGNVIRGGRLVIDLDTGRAVIDGRSQGGNGIVTEGTSTGRVTGRFTVPQRNTQPDQ